MKILSPVIQIAILLTILGTQACTESDENKNNLNLEIETVTDKLHQSFFEFKVQGGPETEIFQVENDGMNGIYGLTRDASDNLAGDEQNLFDCIQQVNPSVFQLLNLRNATNSFSACRGVVSPLYLEEIRAMVHIREQKRVVLYGKFYRNELSGEDVENELKKLQAEIRSGADEIKNKYSSQFRACLLEYIKGIQGSINGSQWSTFKDCI